MADRPLVCRACKEAMPDIDWNNPCPHWKETPEYVASLEGQLTEARRDIATLTKQRDDYIDQLSRLERRLEWWNELSVYRLKDVEYGQIQKLLDGELEE